MGYRGRLIWPFVAEIYRLDTAATAAGPPTPGYDEDFREPVRVPDSSPRGSHGARKEMAPIRLPCQVEVDEADKLQQFGSGQALTSRITLVFHFRDLELNGLVDPVTGKALLRPDDRLGGIYETSGALVQTFPDPPGMYATRVEAQSHGLSGLKRNLLLMEFNDREQGSGRV